MSCTTCGSKTNCHCSDNCPNKTTVPCGASLCDVLGLLELYITNTASEVSVINNYLNITKHDLLTSAPPTTPVSTQTAAIALTWAAQATQKPAIVHDDDSAYSSVTGLWTCPTSGRYSIDFSIKMSIATGNGWYTSGSAGMIQAAVVKDATEDVYVGGTYASVNIQKSAYISGSIEGFQVAAGDKLCLKIINTTGTSYASAVAGDFSRMSIRKV